MRVHVKTIFALIDAFGGHKSQTIEADGVVSVSAVIKILSEMYGEPFRTEILDEHDTLNGDIIVFINGRNIHVLEGLDTVLSDGDELLLFPSTVGG